MSNDQTQAAAAIYAWDTQATPTPDSKGRYPNRQDNANAAVPVYRVTGTPSNAVPIKLTTKPVPDSQGRFPTDPDNPNSAVPVYFVTAGSANAVPVWVVSE